MSDVIQTDHLTKRYGRSRGIEDVSLVVTSGEVFGLLGSNGAGKTTAIRTLLGLLRPTSGTARIFGLDTRSDSRAIRARMGNLAGDFGYDEQMTGRELLQLAADLRGVTGIWRAEELAQRFEADLSRRLGEHSRGNRQKIGLIHALFHEPELLLLDEPTSGLDPLMQEEFLAVVAEQRDRGATVVLSSHDLDEVQRACSRVGIIRAGRLVDVADVSEMRDRASRSVTVRFEAPVAPSDLAAVPGVTALAVDGVHARFRVAGDLDGVVKALARHHVRDLEIMRPTLDELFLTYYRREDGA